MAPSLASPAIRSAPVATGGWIFACSDVVLAILGGPMTHVIPSVSTVAAAIPVACRVIGVSCRPAWRNDPISAWSIDRVWVGG